MSDQNLERLAADNELRWQRATYDEADLGTAARIAEELCAANAQAIYRDISNLTGVPWHIIALIHYREASQSWSANIANGQPWDRRTTWVPAGRGPFKSFEAAAVDALTNCPPFLSRQADMAKSIGGVLTMLEEYNGLGYFERGVASPYIWAASSEYSRGLYIADGRYDPNKVDIQLGCAIILKQILASGKVVVGAPVMSDLTMIDPLSPKAGAQLSDAVYPDPPEPPPLRRLPALGAQSGDMASAAPPPPAPLDKTASLMAATDKATTAATGITALLGKKYTLGAVGSGAAGATAVVNSDPDFLSHVHALLHNPAFGLALMVLVLLGLIFLYYQEHVKS